MIRSEVDFDCSSDENPEQASLSDLIRDEFGDDEANLF